LCASVLASFRQRTSSNQYIFTGAQRAPGGNLPPRSGVALCRKTQPRKIHGINVTCLPIRQIDLSGFHPSIEFQRAIRTRPHEPSSPAGSPYGATFGGPALNFIDGISGSISRYQSRREILLHGGNLRRCFSCLRLFASAAARNIKSELLNWVWYISLTEQNETPAVVECTRQ
jgi:hypothetical protein